MRTQRGRMTLMAVSVLAYASVLPLTRVLAAATEQAPVQSPPAVQPAPLPQARLLAALRSKIPIDPVAATGDPYPGWQSTELTGTPPGAVCGVQFESDQIHYRLSSFANPEAARAAGAAVTHFGACGTCSTLQDLAVYLEKPDLTAPVRSCAMSSDASVALACLEALGFSTACAQTWLYDAQNTRRECFAVCMWSWIKGEAATRSDGRLNDCLQCDEDRSGPVFKAVAGRTRRNSGIQSSIPRSNEEIAPVVHDYVTDLAPR